VSSRHARVVGRDGGSGLYLAEADELGDAVNDLDECLEADDQIARVTLAIEHAYEGEDEIGLERLGGCV
jgi:hypothetical protein